MRTAAGFLLAVICGQAAGSQPAGTAWAEFFRGARPTAGFSAGFSSGESPLASRIDLAALFGATRMELAECLLPLSAITVRVREWLRSSASPLARRKGAALAGRARRAAAHAGRRFAAALPVVARQLRAALDSLAGELGVLPLLRGTEHALRGLVLLGGRLGDHVHAHLRPPAAGACAFRSAGAFERHFALDAAVLESRSATACQPLKRAARQVLVLYHPDKLAVSHPGCSADLSDRPMQAFLVDYASAKARLCR